MIFKSIDSLKQTTELELTDQTIIEEPSVEEIKHGFKKLKK